MSDDSGIPTTCTPCTPHGGLEKILDNVYVVQGSFNLGKGILIGRTMSIIKRGDDLTILNSLRVDDKVEAEIKNLGTVKHIVRMCGAHGCDDAYYINAFPDATYWSLDGIPDFPNTKKHDKALTEEEGSGPIDDMKVILVQNLPEKAFECVIWIPDNGGTLFPCDIVQNTIMPSTHINFVGRLMTNMMGFTGACKCVPLWRMAMGKDHSADAEKIFALDFENLIPGHGDPKIGGAKALTEANLKAAFAAKK